MAATSNSAVLSLASDGCISEPKLSASTAHNEGSLTASNFHLGAYAIKADDASSRKIWNFDLPDPCICPFDLAMCDGGLTLSFWWKFYNDLDTLTDITNDVK